MSYVTFDTISQPTLIPKEKITRNTSSMASRPKSSSLALTNITKTISNYFFKPEKLPQAFEDKVEFKTISKPFYTKNRKLLTGQQKRNNFPSNGFKNMLRAKSTVIKQKNLR